jgi:hypothetical protein
MSDQTAFAASVKLISVKSLVSGDKEGEIRLRFRPTDEVLDGLNRLHRGDAEVWAVLVPMPESKNRESNGDQAVPKREKRKPQG